MIRKILISLLALTTLCVLLAGLIWYLLGDEAFVKRQLHAAILRATGRSLQIDGTVRLDLGSSTTIEARDMRLSNPGWAAEPDMAKAGHLRASVDLMSLFGDQPVIHDLQLNDCRLTLIRNSQGDENWQLFPKGNVNSTRLNAREPFIARLQVDQLQISHCELTHDTPERGSALHVLIDNLAAHRLEDGSYQSQASGQVAGFPLTLSGQFTRLRSFWEGGPFKHDIALQIGQISLQSSGSIVDARTGLGADVTIRFSGPEFAQVTDYLTLPAFSHGAFDFSLRLNTENAMTLLDVNGDLGSFDLLASGELDRLLQPSVGSVEVTATGPDLDALGRLFGIQGLVKDPFTFKSAARVNNGRTTLAPAILSTPQDRVELNGEMGLLPDLRQASIDISLQSDDIGRWAALWDRPIRSAGALSANGRMNTDAEGSLSGNVELQHKESRLKVIGSMGKLPTPKWPDVDFEFDSSNLSQLAGFLAVDHLPRAPARAKGHFSLDQKGAHFKNVVVGLANNRAQIDGTLTGKAQFAGSEFHARAEIPSTASLGLLFGYPELPDQPLKINAMIQPAGKGLKFQVSDGNLGEIQLSLNGAIADVNTPSSVSADVDVELPSARLLAFLLPDTELPDLPLVIGGGVRHQSGKTRLQQLHLALGHTVVDVDGEVDFSPAWVGSRIKFSGQGKDLTELVHSPKLDSLPKDFSFSGQWSKESQVNQLEDVEIRLGQMSAVLNGTMDNLFAPADMALQVQLDVPDASVLNDLLGQKWTAEPLSARSRVEGSLQAFTLGNLAVQRGATKVTGELQVKQSDKTHLTGSLQINVLELQSWLDDQKSSTAAAETATAGTTSGTDAMVFTDDPVLKVGKHPFDVDIDMTIERLDWANAVVKDISLRALMRDDELRLDPLEAHDQNGSRIAGKLALDGTGPLPLLDIVLHGEDLRIGLAAVEGQDPATYPPADVEIDLHGSGETWHEMASSMNGRLRLFQGKGLIAATGYQPIFSNFLARLFSILRPAPEQTDQSKYSQLVCRVIAADIASGQVKVGPVITQTDEVTMVSSGAIDLVTERLDLTFNSKPRKGLGLNASALINPFIKVGGTLAAPAAELDAARGAINSGAALATVGISVLAKSLSDRFLSSSDPCGDARKSLENRGQRKPENRGQSKVQVRTNARFPP